MVTMTLDFEIFAPQEIIFELFTNPGHLREWYPAMACETRQFSLDAFAGVGFSYRWGDEEPRRDFGTFTRVVAPEGYSATVVHDGDSALEHTLTVKLTNAHGKTQIGISEDGFVTATDSERCEQANDAKSSTAGHPGHPERGGEVH